MEFTFPLFGLTGYAYGLVISLSTAALLILMGIIGYRRGFPTGTVRVFGLLAIPLALVFARLVFCLFNVSLFTETYENPWLMLRFFDGGLSMVGALLGLILAAFSTSRLMKIRFASLMDALTLPLGLWLCALRAAEGFTDLGVGKVVEASSITKAAPWLFLSETAGIATEYRLAVYRYEAVAALLLLLFMVILTLRLRRMKDVPPGDASLLFFALYGASQMLLESMRDDGHLLITFLRVSQVAAALMPIWATAVFTRRYLAIRGKMDIRVVLSWVLVFFCVAGGIALEFSLDGRLSLGAPSMLRDYLLMGLLCATIFGVPFSLFSILQKKVYREGHIAVHLGKR